jgi:hypothetical protein
MVLEEQPEKVAEAFMIFAQVPIIKKKLLVSDKEAK